MTTLETISQMCIILLSLYVLISISIILEVQKRINRKMNELIFQIEQYREEQEHVNIKAEQEPCDNAALERQTEKSCQYRDEDGCCWTDEKCKYQSNDEVFCQKQTDTQNPCEDAISREDAIHAFDYLIGLNRAQIQDILFKLPSVTPKPTECDDSVSRQAVLDNIKNGFHWESVNGITTETVLKQVIHDVEIMPSVQPKPKTGRWIDFKYPLFICSECKAVRENESFLENYCPNCGCRMVEPQESEE